MSGGMMQLPINILVNAIFWCFRLVTWGLLALQQLALVAMQIQYVDQFPISSCDLIFVSFWGFTLSFTCEA